MQDLTGQPCPNIRSKDDLDRVVVALRENDTFNRAQVAWLMSLAGRWGYDAGYEDGQRDEQALANVAAQYADRAPFDGRVTASAARKVAYRAECDAAARLPRPGDFKGRQRTGQAAA